MNTLWKLQALGELLQLEADGLVLPMPAYQIVEIESQGGVVDLVTGKILWGAAEGHTFKLTDKGKEHVDQT